MKGWSFKIATVGGTEVRIHATFLMLLAFFAYDGEAQGGTQGAIHAMVFLCAMFLCVLLHEFGHVFAAKRYGIKTPDITLLPIGGVARLERMPREPAQELVVAICGPLVNVVIFSLIYLTHGVSNSDLGFVKGDILSNLAVWNLWMVIFNMIPAFPMDGGRVLRALLAMMTDYSTATRLAATLGQAIAVVAFVGVLFAWHNPLLLIVAVFIFLSAGQEAAAVSDQEAVQGLKVSDAMLTDFHVLREQDTLREAVDLLLAGTQHDFPVIDGSQKFRGLLTRRDLIASLAEHGATQLVSQSMQPCENPVAPQDELGAVMTELRLAPCGALPVLDPASGRLVGMLTTENVGELLMVRTALTHAQAVAA